MARPWYAFYPADYARDTGHLSLTEHGAYRALMDHYYSLGEPLEKNVARLLHLCRANSVVEKRAVRRVLEEFFVLQEGHYHHPRIDAEIARAAEAVARGSFAGKASAAKRQRLSNIGSTDGATAKATAEATDGATQSQASQSQPQSQEENDSGFAEFWQAYPRKEARGAARKAYDRVCASAAPGLLIAAAAQYARKRDGQDSKFTRTAASWLAQECWLDDAPPPEIIVAATAWDGAAAKLAAEIGAAYFQSYFAQARFVPGPPVRIAVAKPHLRDLIARKFSTALARVFGEFELEVSP